MSAKTFRIVILGGYGTFGGRLAQLLAPVPSLTLVIAGRSLAKAQAFVSGLPAAASLVPAAIDRDSGLEAALAAQRADIVVDATGPFQAYGSDPYRVVRATLAVGANYLDLADGSEFVEGIDHFDVEARAKGLFVLAGVSSFPVLTAAVVRALAADLPTIASVTGGIAPSPYAGVGENVIRAIMSYAGQPIRLVRGGHETTAYAITETRRYTIAPPGRVPLRSTRFSLVDVPDLILVPRAIAGIGAIWMGAGPVPEILHRALNALAWLVRLKVLPTLAPFAGLCFWAINVFRWGEHRGGMFVVVAGTDAGGRPVRRSWHLLAEGNDGPLIPSMAVEAIVLKLLSGEMPAAGARAATTALELGDYDRVFAGRTIFAGRREDDRPELPLYQRLIGDAWDGLPLSVQQMHLPGDRLEADGQSDIEVGLNPLARLLRGLMGFPEAGKDVPLDVTFSVAAGVETWTRRFGGNSFSSTQRAGRGRDERLLVERFGPTGIAMAVVVAGERLSLVVRRWSFFGLPLPLFLAPRGELSEFEQDGRFHFNVRLSHPLCGLIVHYRGWLRPLGPEGGS